MTDIILVCIASFFAWFVDAVAWWGGLIQIPALFIVYPDVAAATLLGTNKIPAFSGTALAARQYAKRIAINRKIAWLWMLVCALSAIVWSHMVSIINPQIVKPIILVALILVAIYTYTNKKFGTKQQEAVFTQKNILLWCVIGLIVWFYDGFLGPWSGNLLILWFVGLLWYDFLRASAYSKLLNLWSNFGSILLFGFTWAMIWSLIVPMTISNMIWSAIGTRLAFLKWNSFIRIVFISAITLAIVRYARDIFMR